MKYRKIHGIARACLALLLTFGGATGYAVTAEPPGVVDALEDFDPTPTSVAMFFVATNPPITSYALVSNDNSSLVSVSLDTGNGDVTFAPAPDQVGTAVIVFSATDGDGTDQWQLTLNVSPVNDAPSFTAGADETVLEDAGAQVVATWASAMSAGPADESGQTLMFNVTDNNNPTLFAVAPAVDGTTGDLTYTVAPDRSGSATISLNISDNGGVADGGVDTSADQTFTINVTDVNDVPSFTAGADETVEEDSGAHVVPAWATALSKGPADEDGQTLTFNVTDNNNPTLFVVAPAVDGTTGDLTYTVAPDRSGSATITLNVSDDGGVADGGVDTSLDQTFTINVTDINDAPSFSPGPDVTVDEDAGPQTMSAWAKSMSTGPADEAAQVLTFNIIGNDNPALFSSAPVVDETTGDLSFTAAPDANGVAKVTLNLSDDGGTADGGADTSGDETFTITVGGLNDAPSFAAGGNQSVLEDAGAVTVPAWATALSKGPADEVGQTLSFDIVSNSAPALFASAPVVDGTTGDLTFATAANANGTATITVALKDDGGGATDTSSTETFDIEIVAVNDPPTFTAGPAVSVAEDAGPQVINTWATSISAGPGDESTQSLTFNIVDNSNPGLFSTAPALDAVTGDLTFESGFDANGTATITVNLSDNGGTADAGEDTSADQVFTIAVGSVSDLPAPADDGVVIDEDSGPVLIAVLANDYLAEEPTVISAAGIDGASEGEPQVVIDENGDPIGGANGTVTIVGDQIEYEPKANFFGTDTFSYTITDTDGDSATATVTVTVNPVNDPPTAPALRNFTMMENSVLVVEVGDGLLFGSYDVEGAVLDADGLPVGSSLTIQVVAFPAVGVVSLSSADGSFTYTPPVDFTGTASMTYRVSDGSAQSAVYEARIAIFDAPEPPPPPPPGEVVVDWNLTNVPLEQSTSVSPNVIIMMDDSGSMDWNMSVRGADDQGGFVISNSGFATSGVYSTTYYYLWDLDNNIFGTTNGNGRILPTEQELETDGDLDDNQYGVWRARNAEYNRLYYNPEVRYTPWVGQDAEGEPYVNAVPEAIRLNPWDPTDTFPMLDLHTYYADNVPQWKSGGGREDKWVNTSSSPVTNSGIYIPRYYTTTGTPPLQWNDPHTLVEILPGNEPFAGGANRDDCVDPLNCTYEEEIQNFANFFQYYRTREYAAKNGLGKVVSQVQDIRIGYETINNQLSEPVRDMNDLHSEGNKKLLMDEIYRANSSGGTPLRRALDRAGRIFSGTSGTDPILPAPEGFCQQNFTLLFSDGYWNGSYPPQDNEDGDNSSDFDGGVYADTKEETLADVAMFFYENDLRGGMDDLVPVSQRDRLGAPDGTFDEGARMHQHMKTFTVAFGVVGDVDPTAIPTDPTLTFAWPDPLATPQGKIDDMLHAAVNGRGQFLSAVNPQDLQTALEAAFLEFTQAASSTSAAAFNSTSLQSETLLFRGFYDLRDFTGELTATVVGDGGVLAAEPEWRASEQLNPPAKLPNDRKLVTFDRTARGGIPFRFDDLTPDQQLVMSSDQVGYIRGQRGAEQPGGMLRRRPSAGGLLGDIVNSSPVFIGEPRGLDRDQAPYPLSSLYSAFAAANEDRPDMVYVGANDGILHGFDALTGEELFGYVPNKIIDGSQTYRSRLDEFTSPFYQHKYFVDLSPRPSDAFVRPRPGAVSRSWNTVLMGGLGAGGKGFFALNVNDPANDFSSESSAANAVMWEFTDEDDTSPSGALDINGAPVKDLGYSLSLPTIAMSNVDSGGEKEWVAVFGNGPNSTAGIAKLFVLFMDRGLDGWAPGDFVKIDTGRGVPVAPDQLAGYPNGLGTPALVDTDLNGTVDWVYAGDRLGNLYRFDLCNRDVVTQECAGSSAGWTATRLFTATYDEGGIERLQPILSQPLVIKHPTEDGFLVVFGTGSYMTREDADSEEIQSIYAIWDRGSSSPATALDDSKALRLVEQTITNVVDDSVSPAQTRRIVTSNPVDYAPDSGGGPGTFGWYVDLDMQRAANTTSGASNPDISGKAPPSAQFPGEKAIRRFVLRNGVIVTTTVLPALDEFSCYGTRPGAILLFDAFTGGDASGGDPDRAVIDFNNDGTIDADDMVDFGGESFAGGLLLDQSLLDGALVDLSVLGGGEGDDTDFAFVCGGNDCVPFGFEPPKSNNSGRLSWRELDANN